MGKAKDGGNERVGQNDHVLGGSNLGSVKDSDSVKLNDGENSEIGTGDGLSKGELNHSS